ncbi:MAG: methyltransferase domain-containing protein [Candidatus Heimdallarchaeota archaeon]|nr:methyltransferase domain-containing protein [Candidatus Heimdallarchaeota archaeon]
MKLVELVKNSYDKIGERYQAFRDSHKIDGELAKIAKMLPEKAHVLDAGAGAGIPVAKFLTEQGIKVTGVDVSETMVNLAQKNVPKAAFLQKDILTLDFPDETFEGIICLYTLWHIPRERHRAIFKNFHRMVKKGGLLVINTGARASEGLSLFFGEPMLWSNHPPQKTLELVKTVGFSIEFEGVLERGGEYQYWVFARKI